MKLILTSFGFNSPIVSEKLHEVLDPADKTVIVLPFAGFSVENTYEREKQGLVQFGFNENNVVLCDKSNIGQMQKSDYIYVPGGDTFKLLHYIQSNAMIEPVRYLVENGAVYIGASAGAALATVNLEYVRAVEDNNYSLTDYDGLGLCNDIVIPHSDQLGYDVIEKSKQLCDTERNMMFVKNCDVVLIKEGVVDYL